MRSALAPLLCALAISLPAAAPAATALNVQFTDGAEWFAYTDDAFRGTGSPAYASGLWQASGGYSGACLRVDLGGVDDASVTGISGGWQRTFFAEAGTVELSFRYKLTLSPEYESSEHGQVMVRLDGSELGDLGADYLVEINGNGNGGGIRGSGWREFRSGPLAFAHGDHTVVIGGYNNQKTLSNESLSIWIDDVRLGDPLPPPPSPDLNIQGLVSSLDLQLFKDNIEFLSSDGAPINGSRHWSQPGNAEAVDWIVAELESYGYDNVVRQAYSYSGSTRYNVYATKIGTKHPEEMYILGAHLDSKTTDGSGNAAAAGADDDASGTSLVLEAARVFARSIVDTEYSIRFAFWNNEETGLNGSAAYVNQLVADQGIESPIGSGQYPEPFWRGMLQHDMILYDHGMPPQPGQNPNADIDIEYRAASNFNGLAIELATRAQSINGVYATDYPAEVTDNMSNTDSANFQSHTAAISLRENRRLAELGNGSNPNYHTFTDVFASYSDDDFLFGFNVAQTSVGTVAVLAGTTLGEIKAVPVPAVGRTQQIALGGLLLLGAAWLRHRSKKRRSV